MRLPYSRALMFASISFMLHSQLYIILTSQFLVAAKLNACIDHARAAGNKQCFKLSKILLFSFRIPGIVSVGYQLLPFLLVLLIKSKEIPFTQQVRTAFAGVEPIPEDVGQREVRFTLPDPGGNESLESCNTSLPDSTKKWSISELHSFRGPFSTKKSEPNWLVKGLSGLVH